MLVHRLSNDFLLPTMITFLNDRDWQTRAAFFRDVACIASQAGFSGIEAFLLPCVEQANPHFPIKAPLPLCVSPAIAFSHPPAVLVRHTMHAVETS